MQHLEITMEVQYTAMEMRSLTMLTSRAIRRLLMEALSIVKDRLQFPIPDSRIMRPQGLKLKETSVVQSVQTERWRLPTQALTTTRQTTGAERYMPMVKLA